MELFKSEKYQTLVRDVVECFPYWDKLNGRRLLLSGASGMIGSLLTDVIMFRNKTVDRKVRCCILATSRNRELAEKRFAAWMGHEEFRYFAHDISEPLPTLDELPDVFIHAASTTHPVQYASEPTNTIFSNVLGTCNMLEVAAQNPGSRFLLLSSVEIYGENRGDTNCFDEHYCGYIDCNTLRAGYPEAKRLSEAMCQAYREEKGVDTVVIRLPRTYGPTMRMSDTKAVSQFIKKGVAGENIVLKSEGKQFYSYAFVSDAVLGMLYVLTEGESGEAYNLADGDSDIALKDLADLVAKDTGTKVVFELPEEKEKTGYSTSTRGVLNAEKIKKLGWHAHYDIKRGIHETIKTLKNVR